jgi:hypothetical protein
MFDFNQFDLSISANANNNECIHMTFSHVSHKLNSTYNICLIYHHKFDDHDDDDDDVFKHIPLHLNIIYFRVDC